jgi:septal ring factor EnvC (AmiA/AmiB activator)
MFKYISEILSQFTKTQRVMALLMVLTTITIITIGPSLIDSITTDKEELELKITKQTQRITSLENHIDTLDFEIRESQKSCTQEIYARENEFIQMLDEIRAEAFNYRVKKTNVSAMMRVRIDTINKHGDYELDDPIIEPEAKVDISPILSKIDKMKKKIKH